MTTTFKRGQIRSMAQYDRGIWDWSILDGCFGNTKISPTDIDGCVERNGRKLFLETKVPGAEIPYGQKLTMESFVKDGHTVLYIWGKDNIPQSMRLITPFGQIEYKNADAETLRRVVRQWFDFAEGNAVDDSEPSTLARAFWRRKGSAYCDIMMAEWAKLAERQSR